MDSLLADLQAVGAVGGGLPEAAPVSPEPVVPASVVPSTQELREAVSRKLAELEVVMQDLQGLMQKMNEVDSLEQGEEHASLRKKA